LFIPPEENVRNKKRDAKKKNVFWGIAKMPENN
jgi:hypothetical protein